MMAHMNQQNYQQNGDVLMMVPFSHFLALKRSTLILVDATEKDKKKPVWLH